MKRYSVFILICFLALPVNTVFGKGKADAAPPKAAVGLSTKGAGTPHAYFFGALIDEETSSKLPVQDVITGNPFSASRGRTGDPGQMPSAFSLKNYAPIPGEQGQIGSCTGWAAAYGAKTILDSIAVERTNKFLTTRNAYSPLYAYHKAREIDEYPEKIEGADMTTVISLMSEFGVPKEVDYRRLAVSAAGGVSNPDNLKKATTGGVRTLFHSKALSTSEDRILRIKSNISMYNPVIAGLFFPAESSFEMAKEQWKPGANEQPDPHKGHAICVVGYDDKKYGGAFEILNSWSEYWGDGGFTWIDYKTFDKYLVVAAVLVDDLSDYRRPFEWTGSISVRAGDGTELPVLLKDDGVYTSKTSLQTGTQLRFALEGSNSLSNGPIYPYVFYADKTLGRTVQVWPSGGSAPAAMEAGKPYTVPSDTQWITTTGPVSADNFIFIFSRQELNISAIRSSFEKQKGAAMDRLMAAAGGSLISPAYGLYEYSRIESVIDFMDTDSAMGMVFSTQYDKDGKTPLDMVKISGGSFTMGSPASDPYHGDDEKQKTITVGGFYIGATEVTVGDFREFVSRSGYKTGAEKTGWTYVLNRQEQEFEVKGKYHWANPSYSQVDNYPVVHISLIDAMEYCNWRSRQEGLKPVYTIGARVSIDNNAAGYRLPTEAEWEYACRAGTNTAYNTGGNSITTALANYYESRNFKPAPVKSYFANNWGLYDMHGNVSEWTQDNYERSEFVTTRGGSWGDDSTGLRSAYRLPMKTDLTLPSIGFRIVRSAR